MANRAYLYATDRHPRDAERGDARIVGLSEAAYLVPLSYRVLLSAAPQIGPSLIWDDAPVGIIGDYDEGLARLSAFLDRLTDAEPRLGEACKKTRAFLSHPSNRRAYLVLEAGEIFEMSETPLGQHAEAALGEILAVDDDVQPFLRAVARRGTYGGDSVDVRTDLGEINALRWSGVGYWSNVLYFDLGPEEENDDALHVDAFVNLHGPPEHVATARLLIPFWTPLLGTAVLLLSVILTGNASFLSSEGWFLVAFFSLYAAATAVCTLAVWGVWWMRHRRHR